MLSGRIYSFKGLGQFILKYSLKMIHWRYNQRFEDQFNWFIALVLTLMHFKLAFELWMSKPIQNEQNEERKNQKTQHRIKHSHDFLACVNEQWHKFSEIIRMECSLKQIKKNKQT